MIKKLFGVTGKPTIANRNSLVFLCFLFITVTSSGQNLFKNELDLPAKGLSQRVTIKDALQSGEKMVLFDETGPGCILHWWFAYGKGAKENLEHDRIHYYRIRIYYDNNTEPDVDVTLGQFFSILQNMDLYYIDNAAIKVVPIHGLNCYFPIPFEQCRIELENTAPFRLSLWVMFDWQEYPGSQMIPYRFKISHAGEFPADSAGSILMADVTGEGFIAGMTKSLIKKDYSDDWFHTGGDLLMMDGEGIPRAIRGIGGEDVFNMSHGVWDIQNDWIGAPVRNNDDPSDFNKRLINSWNHKVPADNEYSYERVMYRIFGPDPIWFYNSLVLRFGTKANDIETIVYYYADDSKEKSIHTVEKWKLAGPIKCDSYEDFNKNEFPEEKLKRWPQSVTAHFSPYIQKLAGGSGGPTTFDVPLEVKSEHGWCDLAASFRGRQRTNSGAQAGNVSAYAYGQINIDSAGKYNLALGFDDWIKVWINGKLIFAGKHEKGFDNQSLEVELPEGESKILIKLSNQDNQQWRLWAFNLKLI